MNETPVNLAPRPLAGDAERVYPEPLCKEEAGFVRTRRNQAHMSEGALDGNNDRETIANATGLACSGGGIRSATFCLGVAQCLAGREMLEKFDFLSTVSGGGYFGSFLSRLIQRKAGVKEAEETLKDNDSWSIRWLRENGYYLAPNGSADLWTILAQMLRNMVAIHSVLLGVFAVPFLFANALRHSTQGCAWWLDLESHFIPGSWPVWACNPWMLPLALVAVVGMLLPGILFWFTQWPGNRSTQQVWQTYFTRWLAAGLVLTVGLALMAGMDSLGLWIYTTILRSGGIGAGFAAVYGSAALAFTGVYKFAGKLTELAGSKRAGLPLMLIMQAGGFAWVLLFWATLATLGHWVLWWGRTPSLEILKENPVSYWVAAGVWLVVTVALAQVWSFVNLSAHQRYYSSRLRRAYLGAANERREKDQSSIVRSHEDDDIIWTQHRPDKVGGPLHLVNTTVNETISGKSQVEQRDRKGISLTVGPAGLSAGTSHHALWLDSDEQLSQIRPIEEPWDKGSFRIFPTPAGDVGTRKVETMTLGQWMGISGAAFSTGTGVNTKLGLSLLLGFANVRLGYWWDSGVAPRERADTRTDLIASQKFSAFISWLLPAPHSLVDELLARFHGPAQQRWYLSDGGHFENTACYELIRRRVRFILCLDCGQDAGMAFEDIANLTRKARIDLDAEIEFVDGNTAQEELKALEKRGWVPQINPAVIGIPSQFKPVKDKDGEPAATTGWANALVARVKYDGGTTTGSVVVFLKPSLTDDMPVDIMNYHRANADFPQQSTADQFFDEAQWESYRRLGEHIAGKVLT